MTDRSVHGFPPRINTTTTVSGECSLISMFLHAKLSKDEVDALRVKLLKIANAWLEGLDKS